MTPETELRLELTATNTTATSTTSGDIEIAAECGFTATAFNGCSVNVRIACEIDARAGEFGLGLRCAPDCSEGYLLQISPGLRKAGVYPNHCEPVGDGERRYIEGIEGLDRPFLIEVVMKADIIDVALKTNHQQRCLINRVYGPAGTGLFFFVRDAKCGFSGILRFILLPITSIEQNVNERLHLANFCRRTVEAVECRQHASKGYAWGSRDGQPVAPSCGNTAHTRLPWGACLCCTHSGKTEAGTVFSAHFPPPPYGMSSGRTCLDSSSRRSRGIESSGLACRAFR